VALHEEAAAFSAGFLTIARNVAPTKRLPSVPGHETDGAETDGSACQVVSKRGEVCLFALDKERRAGDFLRRDQCTLFGCLCRAGFYRGSISLSP